MDRGEMITRPAAVEPETHDEDQLSKFNRGLQQETEISELCRTLRSVVSALCCLIPVLEKLHDDIQHDQGLKRNIQDLQYESDLPKMEMKSNSHQNQTPVSSNTTDIIQPATPDEPETPSLHQPSLPAHYGMNGGEQQSPETLTAPCKPDAAPLDTTHQTSAVTKSDTTSATSMLGTVSTVLTAPVPSEVASSPTTVGSATLTFTNSSAFAPSSDVATGTVDFKLPLISLPPAAPPVQEDPTVHVVVDEDQARVQPLETEALQTPAPVSALPQTVPKSVLVEPTQEAPAPSSSPSGQEAVVETPYLGTASSGLSSTVPGGFATPVLGQAPRISSIKASDFSFKPSSSGKQGGFGQFNFSGTSSSSNQPLISGTPADLSLREKGAPVCGTVDENPATFRKLATQAFQSQTPVLALSSTVSHNGLVEPTKKVPAASTVLKPQSFIKAAHFTYKPSTCEKQSVFGKFNNSATSSSSGLQSNNGSCNLAITERQLGIYTTPSPEQEGPTVHGNVDENQAPDRKLDKQTYQTRLPFLALPSTMPSSPLIKPTQEEPAASICPSSQELVFPFTAVETPASGVLSSGDFATPVFGQPPTILGPQSSMTTANLSFRPSTCGTQKGFGQSSINETSSSFGLQSRVNNTSSFGQSSGSTQVNPSSQNVSPVNFSFHPTSPSRGRQSVRSQPDVSDVDFSFAPRGFSTQSALDETPASSTFRRRRRHRRRRNHSSPVRSSSEVLPFAGREEMWSSSRTTSYIQSGRGRRNEQISVTVQNRSRSLINQSRNHSRGFVEQRRVVRLQEYYQEYLY